MPRLGKKGDAVPGRVLSMPIGAFYPRFHEGYCAELCGTGHREIPIYVAVLSISEVTGILKGLCIGG